MNNSSLLEQVKKDVRSILLTSQYTVPLQKFRREYRGLVGRQLPIRELNFHSVEDFLSSIPDVVRMQYNAEIRDYSLSAVADAQTYHIAKLVRNQKPPKNSTQNGRRPQQQIYVVPPRFQAESQFLPAREKVAIAGLVREYPQGISMHNIPVAYWQMYGKELNPHNNGFSTLQHCLNSVPGLNIVEQDRDIRIYPSRAIRATNSSPPVKVQSVPLLHPPPGFRAIIKSENTTEVNSPVANSSSSIAKVTSPMAKVTSPMAKVTSPMAKVTSPMAKVTSPMAKVTSPMAKVTSPMAKVTSPVPKSSIHVPKSQSSKPNDSWTSTASSAAEVKEVFIDDDEDDDDNYTEHSDDDDHCIISKTMKKNFMIILDKNPSGIWAADFPTSYKELTGRELNLNELGYMGLIELTNDLPNIFRKSRPKNCKSDWKLFNASSPIIAAISVPYEQSCEAPSNDAPQTIEVDPKELIANVKKVLERYPEGIYLENFIHHYTLTIQSALELPSNAAGNLENFLLEIAEQVHLKIDYSNSRKKVQLANHVKPIYNPIPAQNMNGILFESDIPSDAAEPRLRFEWQTIPAEYLSGEKYFKMCLATVVSPSLLWIQLRDYAIELNTLMDNLHKFYNGPSAQEYKMNSCHIVVGMLCAAVWSGDGCWHRAAITKITFFSSEVGVSFVDYGTSGTVNVSNLRYLKKDFLELPAQAIKSRMALIKPLEKEWSAKARDFLLRNYSGKILMGSVTPSKYTSRAVSLWICDVRTSEDVFLNNFLVDNGFAQFTDEEFYDTSPADEPSFIENPTCSMPNSTFSSYVPNVPITCESPSIPAPSPVKTAFIQPPYSPVNASNVNPVPVNLNVNGNVGPGSQLSSEEEFEDDEDDLEQLISQYSIPSQGFVQRINLGDGQRFHIILYNDIPYVSFGDLSLLLWNSEDCNIFYRRSQQKQLFVPTIIREEKCTDIFHQLRSLNVYGINENEKKIHLLPFNKMTDALNEFGHPSSTIRSEIAYHQLNFDLKDNVWKAFSQLELKNNSDKICETDTEKFEKMCVYDLKRKISSLRYEKLKLLQDDPDAIEEVKKFNNQLQIYETRITEIESLYKPYLK